MAAAQAAGTDPFQILRDYHRCLRPVQDILRLAKAYQGPAVHFLWDNDILLPRNEYVFRYCLYHSSEEKVFELLQALVEDDPGFLLLRSNLGWSFLDVALSHSRISERVPLDAASRRVLILLAVPGVARRCGGIYHPLHVACHMLGGTDPAVVDHLIDLDPGVLVGRDYSGKVPLHYALERDPAAPFVAKMVALRPESLLVRSSGGRTPVAGAVESARWLELDPAAGSAVLARLVRQCPGSVARSGRGDAVLIHACGNLHQHLDLLRAIVQADPSALAVASEQGEGRLPFEHVPAGTLPATAATDARELVEKETMELALAVVEYALSVEDEYDEDEYGERVEMDGKNGGVLEPDNHAGFLGHVRRTATAHLPPQKNGRGVVRGSSAFAAAQALRSLNGSRRMDLCRALFRGDGDTDLRLLRHAIQAFFDGAMGRDVVGLYRLNRQGRLHPPTVPHQVQLLDSVRDSLDCTFLHVRVAVHLLVPPRDGHTGREPSRTCL
jgi:hypothetical protein